MATENNQNSEAQQPAQSFDKDALKNYVFLTETLEKLGIGKTFDKVLREGMLAGTSVVEKSAIFTLDDKDQKVRVTPRIEKTEGENGGPFYVLRGFRASLMDKEGKESVSQFFKVFKKTGFTIGEARNLLEGRAVSNRVYPDQGDPYTRYSRINFNEKDESGNFLLQNKNVKNLDFDLAKGLSAMPFFRNITQQQKEDIGAKLEKGYEHSFRKAGAGVSFESMTLYALPFEGALATIDSNGESKQYPANKISMRAVGILESDVGLQNTQPNVTQPIKSQEDLDKAARTAKEIEERKNKNNGRNQANRAA